MPMLIPESLLQKEKDHVEGFAPECAWVTMGGSEKLEHLWTAVCVAVGVIAAVVCQGWEQIQGWLFSMKIDFLLSGSRALTHVAESIGHSQNLLTLLAGFVVLIIVWGYNELADARE